MGSWDDAAVGWDEDPMVCAYADAAFASLERLREKRGVTHAGARGLDSGCGTGQLSERCGAAASVLAIDAAPKMIEVLRAKALPNVDARTAPLGENDGPFDLAVASSVCAFLPDYPATLRTLAATLSPGGLFVQWDWERPPGETRTEESFGLTRREIEDALRGAELELVALEQAFSLAVPGSETRMEPLMGVGRRPG